MKKTLRGTYSWVNFLLLNHYGRLLVLTMLLLSKFSFVTYGQTIHWDKTIGSEWADDLASVQQTQDSGYMLGGVFNSYRGADKTENNKGWWGEITGLSKLRLPAVKNRIKLLVGTMPIN